MRRPNTGWTRHKYVCLVCGWEWFSRAGTEKPARCPQGDCRSRLWEVGHHGANAQKNKPECKRRAVTQ